MQGREKLTLEPTATDEGPWANRIEFDPTGRLTGLIERQNGSWKTAYWPAGGSGYQAPEGTVIRRPAGPTSHPEGL